MFHKKFPKEKKDSNESKNDKDFKESSKKIKKGNNSKIIKRLESYSDFLCHVLAFVGDDADLLNVRTVNKEHLNFLKQFSGPYKNKKRFIMANTGIYFSKTAFDAAWYVYVNTKNSNSFKSAMLYKLQAFIYISDFVLNIFNQNESLTETQRKYDPPDDDHSWVVNQTWVLAQIHKGRGFSLLSDITEDFVMRKDYPQQYSALVKELAAMFKADYIVSDVVYTNCQHSKYRMQFIPSKSYKEMVSLSVEDLNVTDNDCKEAVNFRNKIIEECDKAKAAANNIKMLFSQIEKESENLDFLQEMKTNLEGYLADAVKNVGDGLKDGRLNRVMLDQFVKEFNSSLAVGAKALPERENTRAAFFEVDVKSRVDLLMEGIVQALNARLDEFIQKKNRPQLTI